MTYGINDIGRIWSALQRKEDEAKWSGGIAGHGLQYDSLGRLTSTSWQVGAGWLDGQLGRVDRVRQALRDSGPVAQKLITQTLTGINVGVVVNILISTCKDFALYYGGSVVTGGIIGGIGGAFLGGVGAIPGASAGMAAGGYAGSWVLALLGLKSLVEEIVHAIPDALKYYSKGFTEAWGPVRHDSQNNAGLNWDPRGNVQSAAFDLANGHLILTSAILTAMVAYLTKGKGERGMLLKEISQSPRLGPKVASWLEANEETLHRHPALRARSRGRAGIGEANPPPPPKRPSAPNGERPHGMPKATVPCFKPNSLPQGSIPEFDRQLAGQQAGINDMTVQEYIDGRDAFDRKLAIRDPSIARKARSAYEATLTENLIEQFQASGLSPMEAEEKASALAATKMKALAALHNPDMVAGGKDVIADFGDENINKRIGAQWRRGGRLISLDEAASLVPEALRPVIKMNASLNRCK